MIESGGRIGVRPRSWCASVLQVTQAVALGDSVQVNTLTVRWTPRPTATPPNTMTCLFCAWTKRGTPGVRGTQGRRAAAEVLAEANLEHGRAGQVDAEGTPHADFPEATPHDMRHTAASLAISANANVKAVQTMLGRKSAALTLDTYSDLFPADLDGVAAAFDREVESMAARLIGTGNDA